MEFKIKDDVDLLALKKEFDMLNGDNVLSKIITTPNYWLFIEIDTNTKIILTTKILKTGFGSGDGDNLNEYSAFILKLALDDYIEMAK